MVSCAQFLESIFGHQALSELYMYTWKKNPYGGTTEAFCCKEKPWEKIEKETKAESDIYFGTTLAVDKLRRDRRVSNNTVGALPCLWLDVDIADPIAHKKEGLPTDREDALRMVRSVAPEPSCIVDSGHGLHLYWFFDEPLICEGSTIMRNFAHALVESWGAMFKTAFKEEGFAIDPINLAQLLRLPGTFNMKGRIADNGRIRTELPPVVQITAMDGAHYGSGKLHAMAAEVLAKIHNSINTPLRRSLEEAEAKAKPAPVVHKYFDFAFNPRATVPREDLEAFCEVRSFKACWEGKTEYPSQSERDCAIAAHLLSMGCTAQEVVDAIVHNRSMNDRDLKRPDYYQRTLAAAEQTDIVKKTRIAFGAPKESMQSSGDDDDDDDNLYYDGEQEDSEEEAESAPPPPRPTSPHWQTVREELEHLSGLKIHRFVKLLTFPPTYRLEFDFGNRIERLSFTSIKELRSQTYFFDRIMERTNQYIKPMKKIRWEKFLEALLPLVVEQTLGDTGTPAGVFRSKVVRYLNYSDPANIEENPMAASVIEFQTHKNGGRYALIDPELFQQWHNREGIWERLKLEAIALMFAEIGAKAMARNGKVRWRIKVAKDEQGLWALPRPEGRS
jgi:hypothetical protein